LILQALSSIIGTSSPYLALLCKISNGDQQGMGKISQGTDFGFLGKTFPLLL